MLTCVDCKRAVPDVRERGCPMSVVVGRVEMVVICDLCEEERSEFI